MKAGLTASLLLLCARLAWPQPPPAGTAPEAGAPDMAEDEQKVVHVAYFHNPGCSRCARPADLMRELRAQVGWAAVEWFNLNEQDGLAAHALAMGALHIPEDQAPGPPLVVVGQDYLHEADINRDNLNELLAKYRDTGTVRVWDLDERSRAQAEQIIAQRMERYGFAGVIVAGLVDGVNPCAFATIVFFVSYLAFLGRTRRDMLVAGLAFAAGVFGAYLAIGLGATALVTQAAALGWARKALYSTMIIIGFFFAVLSLLDYKKLREGRTEGVSLQLPVGLKRRIHGTIRERTRMSGLALGALAAGAIVSFLELACTGQIYLPTIVGLLSVPALRSKAVLCLLVYNLAFVAPLLAVLAVAHGGVSSRRLAAVAERHAAAAKLFMCILFAGLALWFAYVLSTQLPPVLIAGHGH